MTVPPPDGSRDHRIEDPTNLWLIHPAARRLLPAALARRISANAVSLAGFLAGIAAAVAYGMLGSPVMTLVGLACSVAWLVADGLDGMIARATNSASTLGRLLDGVCDHAVFFLIYLSMALAVDTPEGWALAWTAGAAHGVQSTLYEGERARYLRRVAGVAKPRSARSSNMIVRGYDWIAGSIDHLAARFDRLFKTQGDNEEIAAAYAAAATGPMRLLIPLSANTRVWAIFIACTLGNPALFWWFELVPLSLIAIAGMAWHRKVEANLTHRFEPGKGVAFEPAVQNRHRPKDITP